MKTVTIEIPDDSELVKEGDSYRIRQAVPKTWEEFCDRTPVRQEYFIGYDSRITLREYKDRHSRGDRNLHTSEAEAEATLALIQLIRLREAWVREWVPKKLDSVYYIYSNLDGTIKTGLITNYINCHTLTFPSETMASQFVGCFRDLLNKAKKLIA